MKMQGFLEILHFPHKNIEFHGFSAFWGARTLQKHQNSLGNINGFHHGGGRASILWKISDSHGNSWISTKSREFLGKWRILHKI